MRAVVVRTRDCQILTGANIYMVSYPFKIFTSVRLTRSSLLQFVFVLFLFLLFVLVQSFFLARAFACLHFLKLFANMQIASMSAVSCRFRAAGVWYSAIEL